MSETYSIGCRQCKKNLWVAQASSSHRNFYSGEPGTMSALGEFLFDHKGHELVFDQDTAFDGPEWEELEADKDVPASVPAGTITFKKPEPNENFPILRFESEDGSCEVGLMPVLYGVRVRAGMVGAAGVDIDYCAGADQLFQIQLLDVVKRIIETFPRGTTMGEINKQLPTYKRRPISEDPCWPALQAFLEKRSAVES